MCDRSVRDAPYSSGASGEPPRRFTCATEGETCSNPVTGQVAGGASQLLCPGLGYRVAVEERLNLLANHQFTTCLGNCSAAVVTDYPKASALAVSLDPDA